jgi:hypothetical protein
VSLCETLAGLRAGSPVAPAHLQGYSGLTEASDQSRVLFESSVPQN